MKQHERQRYSLVRRKSRHDEVYGVYDRILEYELITGHDRADALAEIRQRIQHDALWDKPQWKKSAAEIVEEAEKTREATH